MKNTLLLLLLEIGGITQIIMAIGSLMLPGILHWKEGLSRMPHFLRQMFWVYAAYIFGTNIWLGILSIICAQDLAGGGLLSITITVYAALYWLARVGIQFFYFDKKEIPKKGMYRLGEIALDCNFIYLAALYSWTVIQVFLN